MKHTKNINSETLVPVHTHTHTHTLYLQNKGQNTKEANSKQLEFINHTKKYKYIDKKTDYIGILKKIIPKNRLSFLRACEVMITKDKYA